MTKQEIYVKLGYTGEYTKEVKRRLRELIKKYHPDLNHGDDKTMKLLNEVKGELENNRVDEVFYQVFDTSEDIIKDINTIDDEDDYFKNVSATDLSEKIEILKVEKEQEYNKLIDIDKKLNNLNAVFKQKLHKYEEEKNKIEDLNERKKDSRFLIYIVFFVGEVGLFILSLIFFNVYFIIFLILLLLITGIYIYHKYNTLIDINKNISIAYANKNTYFNDVMDKRMEIVGVSELRFKQYIKYRQKADDIQLYTVEFARKNNKTVTYQKNTTIKR